MKNNESENKIARMLTTIQFGEERAVKLIEEHVREYFPKWPNYKNKLTHLEWHHLFLEFYDKIMSEMKIWVVTFRYWPHEQVIYDTHYFIGKQKDAQAKANEIFKQYPDWIQRQIRPQDRKVIEHITRQIHFV